MPDDAMTAHDQSAEVEAVKVEQVDRDAAADIWRDMIARPGECIAEMQIRAGGAMDAMPLIQAFARHRIAAQSARPPADQDEVEAVEEGVRDYFVNQTGFVTVDGDNCVSACYGGNWIALSPSEIATAAIEALRPFREAAEAKAREDAWQPIETAPRDGGGIDVWAVYFNTGPDGDTQEGRRYTDARWRQGGIEGGGWHDGRGNRIEWCDDGPDKEGYFSGRSVTHWRPLPAPPALEQGDAK
jgi:hypothetical protein